MDVHSWLLQTADRAPPDGSDRDLGIPAFLTHPNSNAGRPTAPKYHDQRKIESTDSSIVAPRLTGRSQRRDRHVPLTRDRVGTAKRSPANPRRIGSSSKDSGTSESVEEEAAVATKTYERRARHKTKADRYQPKAKKRKLVQSEQKGEEPRAKRRKARHNGGRTAELVQKFTLKNGPCKDRRLTLKADEAKGGLFKHGRSSEQVAGRGTGLPDLVFNEMRFLQRPQEHQDVKAQESETKPLRKRDRKRELQEEISAYFVDRKTNDRRAPADTPEDTRHAQLPGKGHQEHEGSRSKLSRAIPDPQHFHPKLPEKAFLAFGNRGMRPSSRCSRSATPYSWSDSRPRPSSVLQEPRPWSLQQPPLESLGQRLCHNATKHRRGDERRRDSPNGFEAEQHRVTAHDGEKRVEDVPSSVPTYEQSKRTKYALSRAQASGKSTMHQPIENASIDRSTSKRRCPDDRDKVRSSQHSARTSDILRVHPTNNALTDHERQALLDTVPDPEHPEPNVASSSPTAKLLRQAEAAVRRQTVSIEPRTVPQIHLVEEFVDYMRGPYYADQRAPPFVGDPDDTMISPQKMHGLPSRSLRPPAFGGQSHQHQPSFPPPSRPLLLEPWQVPREDTLRAEIRTDEDVLDDGDNEQNFAVHEHVPISLCDGSDLVSSSKLTAASLHVSTEAEFFAESARGFTPSRAGTRAFIRGGNASPSQGDGRTADKLVGFWKPHRLY